MSDETIVPPPTEEQAAAQALSSAATAPAARLAGTLTQLPAGVELTTNLDTLEMERAHKPFWFQHGGRYFHLLDPDDVDFDDLVIMQEQPRLMMHILLDPSQRAAYAEVTQGRPADEGRGVPEVPATPMKVGKLRKLVADYTKHFGLTSLGELGGSARL